MAEMDFRQQESGARLKDQDTLTLAKEVRQYKLRSYERTPNPPEGASSKQKEEKPAPVQHNLALAVEEAIEVQVAKTKQLLKDLEKAAADAKAVMKAKEAANAKAAAAKATAQAASNTLPKKNPAPKRSAVPNAARRENQVASKSAEMLAKVVALEIGKAVNEIRLSSDRRSTNIEMAMMASTSATNRLADVLTSLVAGMKTAVEGRANDIMETLQNVQSTIDDWQARDDEPLRDNQGSAGRDKNDGTGRHVSQNGADKYNVEEYDDLTEKMPPSKKVRSEYAEDDSR